VIFGHFVLSSVYFVMMNTYEQETYIEKEVEVDELGAENTTLKLAYYVGCWGAFTGGAQHSNQQYIRYPASDVRGVSYLEEVV